MSRSWVRGSVLVLVGIVSVGLPARPFASPAVYAVVSADSSGVGEAAPDSSAEASARLLDSLTTGQPDHAADYTYVMADGEKTVVHNARRKGSAYRVATVDAPGGRATEVLLRNPGGTMFVLNPKKKTYFEASPTSDVFALPLSAMVAVSREEHARVTVKDLGAGTLDGHPIERYVIAFESEDEPSRVTVSAAKDLHMLILWLEKRGGGFPFSYKLSNVTLEPPASVFAVPAGYKQVKAE